MANRVITQELVNKNLVIREFVQGETVALKDGETVKYGDVLIFDAAEKKYVKYVKATHKGKLGDAILRVYKGADIDTAKDARAIVVRQGELNAKVVNGNFEEEKDADDYKLIAQLERLNILLMEVE